MRTIKATTKRGQQFVKAYENSRMHTLKDCYETVSMEKIKAYYWCIDQYKKEDGYSFRILSYNTFHFTCGWVTNKGLRVETANNSYLITEE